MNSTLKTIITIALTALSLVGAGLIIGSIQENNALNAKSEQFRASFISGCTEGSNAAYCSCVYTDLEHKVGLKGMIEMSERYDESEEIADEAIVSAFKCMDKY